MALQHPVTPDGRYFVVKERLWRLANLDLPEGEKTARVSELMRARREVGVCIVLVVFCES